MIGLGEIPVKDGASIVESRNKIRLLAEDLKFGSIIATRLATITSELIRKMIKSGQYSTINVELGLKNNVFGLFLRFTSKQIASAVSIKTLESIFDSVKTSQTEQDLECVEAFKTLPEREFKLTQRFVIEGRNIIQRLTRDELHQNVTKRSKELNCLNQASTFMAEVDKSLEEIFLKIVNLIPPAWQYSDITCARIIYDGGRFETDNFKETAWKQSADIITAGDKVSSVEVYYLEEKPQDYEGPFLKEERDLIDALARETGKFVERRQAEERIQKAYKELESAHNELQQSQSQLVQTEKMGAVGTLVAGVAHELNNPMMGILNFTQYCLKHTSDDERIFAVLENAEREAKRCIKIVENLLTFSRMEKEGEEGFQKASCADILERVLKLLSYRIEKEKVSVTKHYEKETPEVWIKTNSIQQVFLNFIANALDAVKDSDRKEINIDVSHDGKFVQVTIADTGAGIAPENIERIFEPFFTTKPTGRGTGLGLSISRSIIEGHGGKLTCESKPGEGTKFRILLPMERKK